MVMAMSEELYTDLCKRLISARQAHIGGNYVTAFHGYRGAMVSLFFLWKGVSTYKDKSPLDFLPGWYREFEDILKRSEHSIKVVSDIKKRLGVS
jgi:hypothetical protein